MSEAQPESASPSQPPSSPPVPQPAPKRRRWGRRIIRIGVILLAAALVFRLSLPFLLPWAINRAAGAYGLSCHYERMDLNLLGGDVGLWHVVIAPKAGGEPLLRADYCHGAVFTLPLLRGKLHVKQAVADGASLNIERGPDGVIPGLEGFLSGGKAPAGKQFALDFTPPLRIDALLIGHSSARVRDRAVSPPVDSRFDADIGVSDLGSTARPARFWVQASSQPLLDVLRIDGEGTSAGKTADAHLRVFVHGLHPKPAAGYLSAWGIRPAAESLSGGLTAHLTSSPAADDPNGVVAHLDIQNVHLLSDGQEAIAVDRIALDTDTIAPAALKFGKASVQGVRLRASRNGQGILGAAGFELAGGPAPAGTTPGGPGAAVNVPATASTQSITFGFSQLDVKDIRLWLTDEGVTPASTIALQVPQVSVKQVSSEPGDAGKPAQVIVSLIAPGVARSVEIRADVLPFAERRSVTATVRAQGIRPDALEPYLRALGIRSELNDASLACSVEVGASIAADGAVTVDALLRDIDLSDGRQLLVLKQIKIGGASASPGLKAIRVADVEVDGPAFSARRDADGRLGALGFQIIAPQPKAKEPSEAPHVANAVVTSASPLVFPRVDIDRVRWKGVKLNLIDQAISPATTVELTDAGAEADDIRIDPSGGATRADHPGRFRAWLKAPGIAGELVATGTVTPTATGTTADIEVNGTKINARLAAPYLAALGVEPTLENGSLHARARLDLLEQKDHLTGSLAVSEFKLAEGDAELLALDFARIDGIDWRPDRLNVNAIEVTKPRAAVVRDEAGGIHLAGFRLAPAPPKVSEPTLPTTAPSTLSSLPVPAIALALHKLTVAGASVQWLDRAVRPTARTTGTLDAELTDFTFGPHAKPAAFRLAAGAEGILDALTVAGTISVSPRSASVQADVSAEGVREGALAGYLPAGSQLSVKDGRLKLSLEAAVAVDDAGAASGQMKVAQLSWRDGPDTNLLAFDSALIAVRRMDLPGRVVALDEISLAGLDTSIETTADHQTRMLGVTLGSPTEEPATPPAATQPVVVTAPATRPSTNAVALAAARRKPLPLITLQKLAINIRNARVTDGSRPPAAPLILADANLVNLKPIELLGTDPGVRPPISIRINGALSPVAGAFTTEVHAAPFAPRPTARVDLSAERISGQGIIDLLPELKPQIDGSELTDGRFRAHVEAQANLARYGPAQFDFSHPFDVDFLVRGVELRNGSNGTLLAGLDEMRSDEIRVEPAKKLVTVRALELTKPAATTFRDVAGIHALGLVLKMPAAATQAAAAHEKSAPAASMAAAPSASDESEIRITKLTVSGVDFRFEDKSVSPPVLVPVTGLDVDVRNLSSRLMTAVRPVKFSVMVNAGKVPVASRPKAGALTGALNDLRLVNAGVRVPASQPDETRELFSEFVLDGQLVMFPQPKGYIRNSVSGVELTGFRGIARAQGINIQDGTYDSSSNVRLPGDGSMDTRSKLSLTDLSVTEPPNGPIYRFLHLPAPLDVAIAAARDTDGALAFPIDVPIKQGHLSKGDVTSAAVGAVGAIFVRALAAAPVKAAGAVGDTVTDVVGAIVPLGLADKKKDAREQPTVIAFAAGATVPGSRESAALSHLLDRLQKDLKLEVTLRHELATEDVRRAALRANPSPEQCLALVANLRNKRSGLMDLRAQVSGRARAALAAAPPAQARATIERLRAIDRELASTDDALDRLYDMLRPGADRQADRRTRQASLEIARGRLDAVRDALAPAGISAEKRVRVIKPQFTVAANGGGRVIVTVVQKKS